MKRCFKCGKEKPLEEFYRHPMMADGHLGKCKECTRADVGGNRTRRPQYLAYEGTASRKASRRQRALGNLRRHRAKYPEKYAARGVVGRALRSGKLVKKSCEVCGAQKVEAHHDDYAKPLDVRWLCHRHHRAIEGRTI